MTMRTNLNSHLRNVLNQISMYRTHAYDAQPLSHQSWYNQHFLPEMGCNDASHHTLRYVLSPRSDRLSVHSSYRAI